ncbi:hypothetical protein [Corallibacter sp.]|uniref:hypothetical protein n=1 Tax=Corallibacter sp. TaxID=2038084 RepID=UPI003AB3FCBA
MNHTKSLCYDCKHAIDCSLTSDKTLIWSCSEYEVATTTTSNNKPKLSTAQKKRVLETYM